MKIIRNGETLDVIVLKHFKLGEEEFILYKDNNVYLGMIYQNKIVAINPERTNILMQIIGNLINGITDNNLILLSNDLDIIIEEVSYQIINLNMEQINALTNISTESQPINNNKPHKKINVLHLVIFIIAVLFISLLVVLGILFRDDLGKSNKTSSSKKTSSISNKSTTINGIEIPSGYRTYAARSTFGEDGKVYEYYDLIVRYDEKGNFKYIEYTDNVILDESEVQGRSDSELQKLLDQDECKNVEKLDLSGFEGICKVKNKVYTYGYAFTDKTIDAGILTQNITDETIKRVIEYYKEVETENLAIELFDKAKENLRESKGEFVIENNKKVKLSSE